MVSKGEVVVCVGLAVLSNENVDDGLFRDCAVAVIVVVENGDGFDCCVVESVG